MATRVSWKTALLLTLGAASVQAGCAANPRAGVASPGHATREFVSTTRLHGHALDLHLSVPSAPAAEDVVVLYASGDGGWFGAAVEMFRRIAAGGYYTVGFSSRAFLKIERPHTPLDPAQLAAEYHQILSEARAALHLAAATPAILTGWSRGADFAVLVAAEPVVQRELRGVIAIGLSEHEDLKVNGPEDETDEDVVSRRPRQEAFEPYSGLPRLGDVPCAVIQASGDNYLPAARARTLFGQDTPVRRFYAVDARNHRFAGGKEAFGRDLLDAIRWIESEPRRGE